MRILVIRRDNIGDLVCTTPLLAALRGRYPSAHIAVLVNSYNAAVLHANADVDTIYVYTKLKHRLPGQSRVGIVTARLKMLFRLWQQRFDYVVLAKAGFDRQGLSLARQLRRDQIIGFADPRSRRFGITRPLPPLEYERMHEVEVMARLAVALDAPDALGPLRVRPDMERVESWRARLCEVTERNRLWVAVHISAREAGRRWANERWANLIGRLQADAQVRVLLLWSPGARDNPRHPGDDENAAAVEKLVPVVAARTEDLSDLVAVLSLCDAFIGADGGAMHLAAGLGLPIVALFENLEAKKRRWYPWRVPYELVVPETRDIADISPDQVMHAWKTLCRSTSLRVHTPAPMPSAAPARG